MRRRDFLACTLAMSSQGLSAGEPEIELSYQTFTPYLAGLLNRGDGEEAIKLIDNSQDIIIPVKSNISHFLKERFTYQKEVFYLLFADTSGTVIRPRYPKQSTKTVKNKGIVYYAAVNPELSEVRRMIMEEAKHGYQFIGGYHSHPDNIKTLALNQVIAKMNGISFSAPLPSRQDTEHSIFDWSHHDCTEPINTPDNCDGFSEVYRPQTDIGFIGGIGGPRIDFKIRVFAHFGEATDPRFNKAYQRMDLTDTGKETYRGVVEYFKTDRKLLDPFVELSILYVD